MKTSVIMHSDTNPRILLVDDFVTMRRVVRNMLQELGYTKIDEAASGELALEQIRATNYDKVIIDCDMEGMDGLAVLKAIRASSECYDLPVLMLFPRDRKEHQTIKEAGATHIFGPKTFSIATLEEGLRKVQKSHRTSV